MNGCALDLSALEAAMAAELGPQQAGVPSENDVELKNKSVILEDACFFVVERHRAIMDRLAKWLADHVIPDGLDFWKGKLKRSLVLLSDDDFRDFVEMSTEIITRIKLGETGTVETGPWDEEHLPAETLLYSMALATDPKVQNAAIADADGVLGFLAKEVLGEAAVVQLGGDETVGRGLVKVKYFAGK